MIQVPFTLQKSIDFVLNSLVCVIIVLLILAEISDLEVVAGRGGEAWYKQQPASTLAFVVTVLAVQSDVTYFLLFLSLTSVSGART